MPQYINQSMHYNLMMYIGAIQTNDVMCEISYLLLISTAYTGNTSIINNPLPTVPSITTNIFLFKVSSCILIVTDAIS